jgi:hypothetical protein
MCLERERVTSVMVVWELSRAKRAKRANSIFAKSVLRRKMCVWTVRFCVLTTTVEGDQCETSMEQIGCCVNDFEMSSKNEREKKQIKTKKFLSESRIVRRMLRDDVSQTFHHLLRKRSQQPSFCSLVPSLACAMVGRAAGSAAQQRATSSCTALGMRPAALSGGRYLSQNKKKLQAKQLFANRSYTVRSALIRAYSSLESAE